ncbi:MAG: type 4a pilus biogenesis protein PilO [Deltaproteobacteria bacterium]|nr:type 4a pilus biogenesis protein PilO [Deltaproteobacteria bacterium]
MAKSSAEVFEKLAKAPMGTKIAVFAGVIAVICGAYYFLFFSDLSAERDTIYAQRRKLADDEKKLIQRKKEYSDLVQTKLELEEGLKKNSVKLPASSELPAFFIHLQSQAVAANVKLVKWSREHEVPVETYVKVPVKMEVKGDFYQLNQYFKLLYETPRIITVENLSVGTPKVEGDTLVLTSIFTASTFRQADQPPSPAKEQKEPKKPSAPSPAAPAAPVAAPGAPAAPTTKATATPPAPANPSGAPPSSPSGAPPQPAGKR